MAKGAQIKDRIIEDVPAQEGESPRLTKEQILDATKDAQKRGVIFTFHESYWEAAMNFADMPWFYKAEEAALARGEQLKNTEWTVCGNYQIPIAQVQIAAAHLVNLKRSFRPFKEVSGGKK